LSFAGKTTGQAMGVWSLVSTGLQEIAVKTDVAAGSNNNTYINLYTTTDMPVFNSLPQAIFRSTITGPLSVGVWTGVPTANKALDTKIGILGDSAPGTLTTFEDFERPALNGLGEVAFRGKLLGGNDSGIWKGSGTTLTMVTKKFLAAPNRSGVPTTATFTEFFRPVINNAGNVAFKASLSTGDQGIWAEGNGLAGLHKVAKTGDPVPGTPVTLQTFNEFIVINNNNDQVAFTADLSDGSHGLFCTSDVGTLVKIVQSGDFYVLDPSAEPDKIINAVDFFPGSIEQGDSGFNDAGALAYRLQFTDMSEALVLTTLE